MGSCKGNNRQLKLKVSHIFKTLKANLYLDFKTFLNKDFAPQDAHVTEQGKGKRAVSGGRKRKDGYDGGWEEVC